MKLLGAAIILAASVFTGIQFVFGRKRRIRALESVCTALELMQSELNARSTPLRELAILLSDESHGAAKDFFSLLAERMDDLGEKCFSEIWEKAAGSALPELAERERSALTRLGAVLGRYPVGDQIRAIETCRALLLAQLRQARESYPADQRLGIGLSAGGGCLLLIMLL